MVGALCVPCTGLRGVSQQLVCGRAVRTLSKTNLTQRALQLREHYTIPKNTPPSFVFGTYQFQRILFAVQGNFHLGSRH